MRFTVLKSSVGLTVSVCIIYCLVFMAFPSLTDANHMVYTIQAKCYDESGAAQRYYYDLTNTLSKNDLDYLRIEEIGRSYCVRIGKFKESDQANKFHASIKPVIPSSSVLQAYILDERVKKIFFKPDKVDEAPPSSTNRLEKSEQTLYPESLPRGKSDHEKKGDGYEAEKRLLSAAEEYRLALLDDPENAELMWKLAELYYQLQLTNDAFRLMEKAVGLSPGMSVPWSTKLGMLYLQSGRLEEAAEQFLRVLEMQPEAPNINYYLGRIYLFQNRLDNAREHFIEAVTINPGSAAAYYQLGRTYFLKNNFVMAWTAVMTAQRFGYDSEDFIDKLAKVSQKPEVLWDSSDKDVLIRQIVVGSRDFAEDIIFRLSQGEPFESIASDDLIDIGSGLQYRDPVEIDPKIADVSRQMKIFADPVIIETKKGFHIVQRIPPLTIYQFE